MSDCMAHYWCQYSRKRSLGLLLVVTETHTKLSPAFAQLYSDRRRRWWWWTRSSTAITSSSSYDTFRHNKFQQVFFCQSAVLAGLDSLCFWRRLIGFIPFSDTAYWEVEKIWIQNEFWYINICGRVDYCSACKKVNDHSTFSELVFFTHWSFSWMSYSTREQSPPKCVV